MPRHSRNASIREGDPPYRPKEAETGSISDVCRTPPQGFEVTDAGSVILYRTSGMDAVGWFFWVWLAGWGAGTAFATIVVIADNESQASMMVVLPLLWVIEFAVAGHVLWYFWSVTRFAFRPDELEVEQRLWCFRRRQIFRRSEVTAVRQVRDGGKEIDSYPSWGLTVMCGTEAQVLASQTIDKSIWLGLVIAQWAGVEFEPVRDGKDGVR